MNEQRIYIALELRASPIIGIGVNECHTAEELDKRSSRTTRSIYSAITNLLYGNNVDLYVERGSASSHNMSFIKRLIEMSKFQVISTKFSGYASITIQIKEERYTLRLIPHTQYYRNRYKGIKCNIILDHGMYFKYARRNDDDINI